MTWQCEICGSKQISRDSEKHTMDWCECKRSAVDLEKYYTRTVGKLKVLDTKEVEE